METETNPAVVKKKEVKDMGRDCYVCAANKGCNSWRKRKKIHSWKMKTKKKRQYLPS